MNKDYEGARKGRDLGMMKILLPSLPFLSLKLGTAYLRLKRQSKKAGKIFEKELLRQGFDEEIASELTEQYLRSSHLREFLPLRQEICHR